MGMSKYRNKKVVVDGIEFASKKEANRYRELKLMERAGEISDLRLQVKYVLIPAQREKVWNREKNHFEEGKVIEREVSYYADFVYKNRLGFKIVEDTKGYRTDVYKIKRKLMLQEYGIRIFEV